MNKVLINKLKIKDDHSLLILHAPDAYLKNFSNPDSNPITKIKYDFVQLFIKNKSDLKNFAPKAIRALKEEGLFWISYPKKSSTIETDVSRDHGWDVLHENGFETVSLIAIDSTWSALRFRQSDKIEKKQKPTSIENVPEDLSSILKKHVKVKIFFDSLSNSNRKEYVNWITSAKKIETRERRLQEIVDKLLNGKKNPSQK